MTTFEVGIFNAEVRECVESGGHHRDLADDWADIHYITLDAPDEEGARAAAERKYPARRGFVIDSIHPEY